MNTHIIKIRPKVIFNKIEKTFPNENVNFTINIPTSEIGGLTLLESSIIISFVKLINPNNIFEFGTYMGATTTLLANNTIATTKIVSIDIDTKELKDDIDESLILSDEKINDDFLRNTYINSGPKYILNSDPFIKNKIHLILQNSLTLNPSEKGLSNSFDLIFIDGGHSYEIIKKDTENAFNMANKNCIILWHDYNSKIHNSVTKFLDALSEKEEIYHVENTMLAFMLIGQYKNLIIN